MVNGIVLLFIVFYSIVTFRKARLWSSGIAIWTAATLQGRGEKSRAWQELGAHYKVGGDRERAAACFARSLTLNPRLAPALRNLAWVRVEQGRMNEALDLLRLCTERNPDHWAGWEDYGLLLEGSGQDAWTAYRMAIRFNPQAHVAMTRLGMRAFHQTNYESARQYFARAHQIEPASAEYRWNLACALRQMGRAAEAQPLLVGFPQHFQLTPNMVVPPEVRDKSLAPAAR